MDQFKNVVIGKVLKGLRRCPHCGIASPEMVQMYKSECIPVPDSPGYGYNWAAYRCTTCAHLILAQSELGNQSSLDVLTIYPSYSEPAAELPERVRSYLKQAEESIHSPDGAAMLAGSAVDSMLKEKGLKSGSVHSRIDQAVADRIITADMAEWAHEVRLGSNRPRHVDEDDPYVSHAEAKQSVEFAKTLGHILFVLPNRVMKGVDNSKASAENT